jgi:hypothetical protein
MEEEASYKQKAQDALNKSLILQAGSIAITDAKANEKLLRDTKAEVYKEIGKEGYVYADIDPTTGRKYYYRDIQKPTLPNASGVTSYKTSREIVDPKNLEDVGQGFEKADTLTGTDVNTAEGIYNNRFLSKVNALVDEGKLGAKSQGQYYSHELVVKKLRELDRNTEADELEQLKLIKESKQNSFLGIGNQSSLKNPLEE